MCIRDRQGDRLRLPGPDEFAQSGVRRRPAARRALDEAPRACLLYTSDAADERSSVDLGGRRLIKKNKHARLGVCDNSDRTV